MLIMSLFFHSTALAFQSKGVVVFYEDNHIVIQNLNYYGYTVGTVYGSFVRQGDKVVGELDTYGMEDLYNLTKDESFTVHIKGFNMSQDSVIEWLKDELY